MQQPSRRCPVHRLVISTVTLAAPAQVPANTAANQDFIVPGVRPGDVLLALPYSIVNFVGLPGVSTALCPVRVATADTLPIRFINPTAGAAGPGVSTLWIVVNLTPLIVGEFTIDPDSVASATAANQDLIMPGVRPGDLILPVLPNGLAAGIVPCPVRAWTADRLTIRFANPTLAAVDAASGTWALVNLGLLRCSEFTINPTLVNGASSANQPPLVPGVRPTDIILAIPPNGLAAGIVHTMFAAPAFNFLQMRVTNPDGGRHRRRLRHLGARQSLVGRSVLDKPWVLGRMGPSVGILRLSTRAVLVGTSG